MVKVSIITPTYNCASYIEKTIESVLAQTYKDYELILIEDKSTDNTMDVIKKYLNKYNNIHIILQEKNSGTGVARNEGIKKASGDYIAFIDGDDIWHSTKLEKQINFMEENSYDFTFTAYKRIYEGKEKKNRIIKSYEKLSYNDMLKKNYIGCSTVIYNAKKLGKTYMPKIRKRQDYGLWLALLKKTPYAYGLDEVLTDYLIRKYSVSSGKFRLIKYNWTLFRKIEGFSYMKSAFCLLSNIVQKIFYR